MGQIELAIAHLKAQDRPNYAETARAFDVQPTTLRRRFLQICISRIKVTSEYRQLLNNVQEDTLLQHIDKLTERYIPLTTHIVKNLTKEILDSSIRSN